MAEQQNRLKQARPADLASPLSVDELWGLDLHETCALPSALRERLVATCLVESQPRVSLVVADPATQGDVEPMPASADALRKLLAEPGVFVYVEKEGRAPEPAPKAGPVPIPLWAKILLICRGDDSKPPLFAVSCVMSWLLAGQILFSSTEPDVVGLFLVVFPAVSLGLAMTALHLTGTYESAVRVLLVQTELGNRVLARYPGAADTDESIVIPL